MSIDELGRMLGHNRDAGACSAVRTIPAGGDVTALLLHPSFTPFERVFRKLPEEGLFQASPSRPYTFEMGSFHVPKTMALAIAEYRFDVYRFGVAPFDQIPLERRRFPLAIGYDITINQYRQGNLQIDILPVPAPTQQTAFDQIPTGGTVTTGKSVNPLDLFDEVPTTVPTVQTIYDTTSLGGVNDAALSQAFVNTVGAGNALLPQNQDPTQGPTRFPFTYYAKENQAVQLRAAIFNPITIPIAFFEAMLLGYLMPLNTLEAMLSSVAPCTQGGGGAAR